MAMIAMGLLPPAAIAAVWEGFYTDKSSYAPGDTVRIHASMIVTTDLQFRLLRMGSPEREIIRSTVVSVPPQETDFGSFVDFPDVDLSGMTNLTLEGWYLPTSFGVDDIVIAGQASVNDGTLALGVDAGGYLYARLWTNIGRVTATLQPAISTGVLATWHHLAATYDGSILKLYVDGVEEVSTPATGSTVFSSLPFRLGARAEAPGDMTGIIDGRLDSWAVWPRALSSSELGVRHNSGLNQPDPAPDPASVLLYVGFEDAYGSQVLDTSQALHRGTIVHHGMPRVAGVSSGGHALQLNHDQIVDAGWPAVVQIPLPSDAPSGLYAVQILVGPDFDENNRNSDAIRGFAVRPAVPSAPIAVVLATNTWVAYNGWPAEQFWSGLTPTGMTERVNGLGQPIPGGNNSAYKVMGDGLTVARYHGWKRPNYEAGVSGSNGPSGLFLSKADKSIPLVRWLDDAGMSYAVYSDDDFPQGHFPGFDPYRVVIFHGHDEYWSQSMLDQTHAFLNAGGSVLHLGGNALTWVTVPAGDGLIEVHKYPVAPELGAGDHFSGVNDERIGYWRAVSMCENKFDDVVFGTINDEIDSPDCALKQPNCMGLWKVDRADHWLWDGSSVVVGDLFGVSLGGGNSVGYETDVVVPGILPPGLASGERVVVLAHGSQLGGAFQAMDHDVLAGLSCAEMDAQAGTLFNVVSSQHNTDGQGSSGSINYYTHQSGGAVLGISAISAPTALSEDPGATGGDTLITDLSRRFLDCFAHGLGCPDGVGPAHVGPPSCIQRTCRLGWVPTRKGCGCRIWGTVLRAGTREE